MKRNGKATFLMALLALSATTGWAKEQWAEVVRVLEVPEKNGTTTTQVMVDSYANGRNGRPDMLMYIDNSDRALFSIMLKEYLPVGAVFSYDDNVVFEDGYAPPALDSIGLLSINGEDILDLFPEYAEIFIYAARKRAAAQQAQRGSR